MIPSLLLVAAVSLAVEQMPMHVVPLPVNSTRLLGMSMDDDGFIWVGTFHRDAYRYDPRTGSVEVFHVPFEMKTVSQCLCAGSKVYMLGQTHPRLVIYDRASAKFSEAAYPSAKPNVWYGTDLIDDHTLFFFDRGSAGAIRWDTRTDTGTPIPFPYGTPLPSSGQFVAADGAVWCRLWGGTGFQYKPVGIVRLDVADGKFTGMWEFPKDDAGLEPFTVPATTIFLPFTLKGKIVPFDFKSKRWCRFLDVPRFGELFGFIGGPTPHDGRLFFSLSTYNGTDTGCDGKPFHFCNAMLEFDPSTRRFEFPTLAVEGAYHQVAYMLSAGGAFYATGCNIRESDGTLNRDRSGEFVFLQSRPLKAAK